MKKETENVIINKKYYNKEVNKETVKIVAVRIDGKLLDSYLRLKHKRGVSKDSKILKPIIRAGVMTCQWLDDRGELRLTDDAIRLRLDGLSYEQKLALLELLKQDLQV